jgi:hypothetical protein
MNSSRILPASLLAVASACLLGSGAAWGHGINGFTGPYAPEHWTLSRGFGNGTVDLAGVPSSIVMIGSQNGIPANTDYVSTSIEDGHVMLDWNYVSDDDAGMDGFGFLRNGMFTLLADHNAAGFTQFDVDAGDSFGFRLATLDAQNAPGELTITFFSAPGDPEPSPVPAPLPWLALATGYGWSRRLRRRSVQP